MSLRSALIAGGVAVAAAASPAVASAVTYTVDATQPLGCTAANVCSTISDANAKAGPGDTVSIKAGTYQEPPISVIDDDVTFVAADPGKVVVATNSPADGASTFVLGDGAGAGDGVVLRGLTIGVPASGGAAVRVRAVRTLVDGASLGRFGATADTPVYDVVDSSDGITGGTNTLRSSFVVQFANPAEAGTAPAVRGGAKTTLVLEDSTVVSGPKSGPGVLFNANAADGTAPIPNRITRGTILVQNPAANAVEVLSGSASAVPKATVLDSVVLAPGAEGAGLRAASAAGTPAAAGSDAGDISVTARHVTIAGGARPFALAADALPTPSLPPVLPGLPLPPPNESVGNIAVTAERSIVHGAAASTVTAAAGNQAAEGPSAQLTIKDSDTTDSTVAATPASPKAQTTVTGKSGPTADDALFRNAAARDYHLKVSAPVIDKGGAQLSGESDKDFEGQARVNGSASDLGADEYVNTPPTATLKADKATIRAGESVAFDATGSGDLDGAVSYGFDFGDGTAPQASPTPQVSHVFAKPGTFTVRVGVLDSAGAPALAAVQVTVTDASAPVVAITSPRSGAKLRLFNVKVVRKALKPRAGRKRTRTTTTTTLRKLLFTGTAADDAGVRSVELSLRRVSTTRSRAKVGRVVKTVTAKRAAAKRATAKAAQAGQCVFLDPKAKRFVSRPCARPVFFTVAAPRGAFTFRPKAPVAYRLGSYVLTARATDVNGVVSAPVSVPFVLR